MCRVKQSAEQRKQASTPRSSRLRRRRTSVNLAAAYARVGERANVCARAPRRKMSEDELDEEGALVFDANAQKHWWGFVGFTALIRPSFHQAPVQSLTRLLGLYPLQLDLLLS